MQHITPRKDGEHITKISDFLRTGARNAKTGKQLMLETGLSADDLRHAIRAERLSGTPILCRTRYDADGAAGYFLPETAAEYTETIAQFRSREKELRVTRRALEKAMENAGTL